jgi:1,4-alpha-glucan branching enzyme
MKKVVAKKTAVQNVAAKNVVAKKEAVQQDGVTVIEFSLLASEGSKVSVAGSFNNWDVEKNLMKADPGRGLFKTAIALPPGRHEYKFVVNGIWMADPDCREWVMNPSGSQNSVITVSA